MHQGTHLLESLHQAIQILVVSPRRTDGRSYLLRNSLPGCRSCRFATLCQSNDSEHTYVQLACLCLCQFGMSASAVHRYLKCCPCTSAPGHLQAAYLHEGMQRRLHAMQGCMDRGFLACIVKVLNLVCRGNVHKGALDNRHFRALPAEHIHPHSQIILLLPPFQVLSQHSQHLCSC